MTGPCEVMDPLYRFALCKRHTEGAHGHCRVCTRVFSEQFPTIAEAMDWNRKEDECYDQPAILIE